MFELLFAWAIFTAVLGKSTEAVMHAWKGTAPPSHLRRMARIREREAKAARADLKPSEGFRGWARTVWADSWNAATERHAERWPTKAAKKREYARQRWAWWDGVEEEAGRRWDERVRARRGGPDAPKGPEEADRPRSEAAGARYMAWETPERYGRYMAWEELTDKERELWVLENRGGDPLQQLEDSSELSYLRRERDRVRDRVRDHKRRSASEKAREEDFPPPSDTPDSTPKTPGEGADGGVRGSRTPGHPTVSGGEATIPATRPTTEGDDMAEVINLAGATKFTRALHQSYTASTQRLEEVMAWLHSQNITSGALHDRFQAILRTTADTAELTEKALATCEDQLKVRDAIESAGGVALSKDALLKS